MAQERRSRLPNIVLFAAPHTLVGRQHGGVGAANGRRPFSHALRVECETPKAVRSVERS